MPPPPPPPSSQNVIISMCVCFIFLFLRSRIPIELQRTIAIAMNMEMLWKKRRYSESAMTVNCAWTYDLRTQARGTALMAWTVQSCTVFSLYSRCDTCFVYESTKYIHSSCQHIGRFITTGSTKALPVHGHEDRGGACQCVQLGQLDLEQKKSHLLGQSLVLSTGVLKQTSLRSPPPLTHWWLFGRIRSQFSCYLFWSRARTRSAS